VRLVRIALCNVNTTVGAVRTNVDRAIELGLAAAADDATLVAYPEQLVGGYPPEDLVQWRSFVDAQWRELLRLAEATKKLATLFVAGVCVERGSGVYNCAALLQHGRVLGLVPKEKLPTYNVFYEGRTFSRGAPGLYDEVHGVPFGDVVFDTDVGTIALEVCEDIWSPDGPMRRRCYAGAELVVNISASPYRLGVIETRREMICTRAGDNQCVVAYAGLVGANDNLVFDGGGYIAQNGRLVHTAPRFREGFSAATVDLDRTTRLRREITTWRTDQEAFAALAPKIVHVKVTEPTADKQRLVYPAPKHQSFFLPAPESRRPARVDFCEDLLDALAMGVGDYFTKIGGFKTIGVALSGGRDSLLCLIIAHRWAKWAGRKSREVLRAFFMPTRYSSAETRAAAVAAAHDLDVPLEIVPVDEVFDTELKSIEKMLQPGETLTQMARQNVQARIRAERMWTWSNCAAGLFLQTSNMSEKAVGYSTIGGDGEGALALVANLPKTVVNYLLDYLYETTKWEGIRLTLVKPASAELADDMEDEKDLMPFPVLDACFALYAGEKMSPDEVNQALRAMFPEIAGDQLDAWTVKFARLFTQSIYKWVQAPLSLHVGNLDLDRERALQLPVVQRTEWQRKS
jgi:NAD+ synthase (glutamine-hydrolysing)